jgi:hypothetical protein
MNVAKIHMVLSTFAQEKRGKFYLFWSFRRQYWGARSLHSCCGGRFGILPLNTGLTKYRQSGAFAMDGSKAMSHGSLCGHGFSCMAMPHRNHE